MKKIHLGIRYASKFIEESRQAGYEIRDSVFKVDYNGEEWNAGFWIRPTGDLPSRCGKAKKPDFDEAVLAAIAKAKEGEKNVH